MHINTCKLMISSFSAIFKTNLVVADGGITQYNPYQVKMFIPSISSQPGSVLCIFLIIYFFSSLLRAHAISLTICRTINNDETTQVAISIFDAIELELASSKRSERSLKRTNHIFFHSSPLPPLSLSLFHPLSCLVVWLILPFAHSISNFIFQAARIMSKMAIIMIRSGEIVWGWASVIQSFLRRPPTNSTTEPNENNKYRK